MLKKVLILIPAFAVAVTGALYAEPSNSKIQPRKRSRVRPVDVHLWRAELLETAFNSSPSEAGFDNLIHTYEKVINLLCMPALPRTLQYKGNPKNPECLKFIDKTLALDPENAAAICARDGIDSKSCRKAYSDQEVKPFYSHVIRKLGGSNPDSLRAEIQSAVATSAVRKLTDKLESLNQELRRNYSSENNETMEKLVNVYMALLRHVCRVDRLELVLNDDEKKIILTKAKNPLSESDSKAGLNKSEEFKVSEKTEEKNKQKLLSLDDIAKKLEDLRNKNKKKLNNNIHKTRRILYRPGICINYAQTVQRLDQEGVQPVDCYLDGFYSPQCISALRKYRAYKEEQQKKDKKGDKKKDSEPESNSMIGTF
ncbi:MAG: hypothetical protein D6719_02230 [Candidatus Dadabacteria bacterium]|nr:MAG: hypothetical protein D6719_02230 [Candidatus Dadabacteria bacterium]